MKINTNMIRSLFITFIYLQMVYQINLADKAKGS
jgi:hypothetical protein